MVLKTPAAVLVGIAVAVGVMTAPSAAAQVSTGQAVTWGSNPAQPSSAAPVPVDTSGVLAGKTLTAIDAGDSHACGLADGRAYCWGSNLFGELGSNNNTTIGDLNAPPSAPVQVYTSGALAGRTVTAISAGSFETCAVADGKAYCWGVNSTATGGSSSEPVAVDAGALAGKTVSAIAAGFRHSCAVANGRAYCWGENGFGQLGNDSTDDSSVPVMVGGVLASKTVTAVTVGEYYSCAVAGGKAYCWGDNADERLGNPGGGSSSVPVAVDTSGDLGGKTVTAISSSLNHSCVVADAKAYCWGNNTRGQLGKNTTLMRNEPAAVDTSGVLAGRTITAIAAGDFQSCAVADARAYCWGANGSGQLGNNGSTDSAVPVPVLTAGALAGKIISTISVGSGYVMALAAGPPKPPASVAAVPGTGTATVSWTAPVDNGGSPVMEYVATAVPGAATCTTAGTSCTVPGLSRGTAYTFTVTARNAIGTSPPSAPSAPVTLAAAAVKPGKVKGGKVKVRKGKAKVTWKRTANATSYKARISKPGGKKYKAWKITSKRVFKAKVRKGKKYRFQVAATGTGGRGPVTTKRFKGK